MCAATASAPCSRTRHLRAERRHRSAARRGDRALPGGHRSRHRAKRPRTHRRPVSVSRGRGRAPASCATGGGVGWRAAGLPLRSGRAWWRCRRMARRTRRAAQNASHSAGVNASSTASSAKPTDSASSASCSEPLPQRPPLDRGRALKAPLAGRAASAACSDTPDDGRSHARMFSTVPGSSSRTAARPPAGHLRFRLPTRASGR